MPASNTTLNLARVVVFLETFTKKWHIFINISFTSFTVMFWFILRFFSQGLYFSCCNVLIYSLLFQTRSLFPLLYCSNLLSNFSAKAYTSFAVLFLFTFRFFSQSLYFLCCIVLIYSPVFQPGSLLPLL